MNLYVSQDQVGSMRAEYCFVCHKIRSVAFWQPTPTIPVVISVSAGQVTRAVRMQEFCDCAEKRQTSESNLSS